MQFKNIVSSLLFVAVTSLSSYAGDLAEAGRKLVTDRAESIIRVSITSKTTVGNNSRESTKEIVATVIDASGLAVTSLATVNPTSMFANIRTRGGQFKSEVVSMKYIMNDGTEIPAKVALEDSDLDIVFLAPKEKLTADQAKLVKIIDLANVKGSEVKVMDDFLVLSRLGKDFRRVPSVRSGQVAAVITKPRTIYYPGADLGAPVFNAAGELVGFSFVKRNGGRGVSIIRPVADVKELLPQAKEAMAKKQ